MNARRNGRVPADERSVLSSTRGLPAWTAVLLAVAISLTGVAIDAGSGELGTAFTVAFFLGCVVAVLAVARRSVFVAGVQPPIIMAILVPLVYVIAGTGGTTGVFSRTQLVSVIFPLVTRFPLMAVTMVVVVALALVRAFVLEPHSGRQQPARRPRRAGAHAVRR